MYVPTRDVDAVHDRARAAGADIAGAPAQTRFGSGAEAYAFTLRDREGFRWTFGTYTGVP